MNLNEIKYQLELAAYAEKIALAELEEAKAAVRTKELRFELTRFNMQMLEQTAKALEKQGIK